MSFQVKRRGVVLGLSLGLLTILMPLPSHLHGGEQGSLRKVAVIPFLSIRGEAERDRMVKGLWGEFFFRAGRLPSRAASEVTSIFYRQLVQLGGCETISMERAAAAMEDADPFAFRRDFLGEAVRVGRELGVYGVVIGGVYHFEQRQGSPWGVERPASVAFDAHLVRVEDREVIWSGRFDETQRSLSEDLLKISVFVKGGGRWVTVEKLTAIGVESVLRSFPSLPF